VARIRGEVNAEIDAAVRQAAADPAPDPDDLFEPWWGGERALAYLAGDTLGLRLVSADGVLLTERVPEVADLAERLGGRRAILDGTLVAVDASGRLDEPGLLARLDGQPRDDRPDVTRAEHREPEAVRYHAHIKRTIPRLYSGHAKPVNGGFRVPQGFSLA